MSDSVWSHRQQPTRLPPSLRFSRQEHEWVAISFFNAWKWKEKVKSLSPVRPLATPWTAAHQAPASVGFSRQEYWSGVPLPSPKSSILLHKLEDKKYIYIQSFILTHIVIISCIPHSFCGSELLSFPLLLKNFTRFLLIWECLISLSFSEEEFCWI